MQQQWAAAAEATTAGAAAARAAAGRAAAAAAGAAARALEQRIQSCARLLVAEQLVRPLQRLKLIGSPWVVWVLVRVLQQSQLAVGLQEEGGGQAAGLQRWVGRAQDTTAAAGAGSGSGSWAAAPGGTLRLAGCASERAAAHVLAICVFHLFDLGLGGRGALLQAQEGVSILFHSAVRRIAAVQWPWLSYTARKRGTRV